MGKDGLNIKARFFQGLQSDTTNIMVGKYDCFH